MILFPQHINSESNVGGKAGALAALHSAHFQVPPWFVITPVAFFASLSAEQRNQWENSADYNDIQQLLQSLQPTSTFKKQLGDALRQLCPEKGRVAVRSSAAGEDGAEHSFAGQLESVLFVPEGQVLERVKQVWCSGFSERIYTYYRENQLTLPPPPPAVIIQRMINADVAGVAFSADPVSGRRGTRVVGAVFGLGSALVSGDADADTYFISRQGEITKRELANKKLKHVMDEAAVEGVKCVEVDVAVAEQPALSDANILAVARMVEKASAFFACPQDIEWALEHDDLYLLQSRPITSLHNMPDPDGELVIWDNSNIAESYRGVTTPLTFSFACRSYESVYREFCKLMRVPSAVMAKDDDTFGRMLGLIRGHVYYNLISWYRVLAMLPGFQVNRRFMEQMMGVKQAMPDEIIAQIAPPATTIQKFRDSLRLISTLIGLAGNHLMLTRMIRRFYQRLNKALADPQVTLVQMRADELVKYYRDLERQLLRQWDAPLVNDFFAMIFYGVLRKLASKWCDDKDGTLQNDLLVGEGDIISAEPAKRIKQMAQLALQHEELVALLVSADVIEIEPALVNYADFFAKYRAYLAKFGDRCLDELKLESPTLYDDPLPVLRSIGHMAKRLQTHPEMLRPQDLQQRHRAMSHVDQVLQGHPVRSLIFKWVLKHARVRVSDRENLRFERTRVFGRVRAIFVELGKRLQNLGLIDAPRDVFYFQVEELLGFAEGTIMSTNLRDVANLRKIEFDTYRDGQPPGDRFETHGMVCHAQDYRAQQAQVEISGDAIQGIGCCAGVVKGQVRVVRDPRGVELRQGEILVAERTDPGWIMLFPAAAGLLVEHGSLLSHSAIVAREMGIPAVVALTGVTGWLQDGDWVEMDGRSGAVKRIEPDEVGHD